MRHGCRHFVIRPVAALAVCALLGGRLSAQDDGLPGLPEPCGMECFQTAGDAARACRDGGGGFLECLEVFATELRSCREAAGCEDPVLPELPPLCGEECLKAARDGVHACREGEGDLGECLAAVRTELRACLDAAGCELPPPPDQPPPCGAGCLREAIGTARDCLGSGGSLRECAGAFRATLEACRDAAGCNGGDDGGGDDGDGEVQVLALMLEGTFIRGDANSDAAVNITDPVLVLNFLFIGGTVPSCMDGADANDDGTLDISDPAMTLNTLFLGASPLPEPYPGDGLDPTADDPFACGLTGSS